MRFMKKLVVGFIIIMNIIICINAEEISDFTTNLLCELNAKNDSQKSVLIYSWVYANINYDYEKMWDRLNNKDVTYNIVDTFKNKKGICYDKALLMCYMLKTQNIDCAIAYGYTPDKWWHNWVKIYIDDKVIICDPTLGTWDCNPNIEYYVYKF